MMSDWASSPTEAAPACPTYAADMPGQTGRNRSK
jgi:hypothetical protein